MVKKPKPKKRLPKIETHPPEAHQCTYMVAIWGIMNRGLYLLEEHYHGHQSERMRGAYLPHIYELVSMLKPIHLSWPYLLPYDKKEIWDWAYALHETWLQTRQKRIENEKDATEV